MMWRRLLQQDCHGGVYAQTRLLLLRLLDGGEGGIGQAALQAKCRLQPHHELAQPLVLLEPLGEQLPLLRSLRACRNMYVLGVRSHVCNDGVLGGRSQGVHILPPLISPHAFLP